MFFKLDGKINYCLQPTATISRQKKQILIDSVMFSPTNVRAPKMVHCSHWSIASDYLSIVDSKFV